MVTGVCVCWGEFQYPVNGDWYNRGITFRSGRDMSMCECVCTVIYFGKFLCTIVLYLYVYMIISMFDFINIKRLRHVRFMSQGIVCL